MLIRAHLSPLIMLLFVPVAALGELDDCTSIERMKASEKIDDAYCRQFTQQSARSRWQKLEDLFKEFRDCTGGFWGESFTEAIMVNIDVDVDFLVENLQSFESNFKEFVVHRILAHGSPDVACSIKRKLVCPSRKRGRASCETIERQIDLQFTDYFCSADNADIGDCCTRQAQ